MSRAGAIMMALMVCGVTAAATINVPGNFTTIQAAVDAANNGDEIIVAPGTYTGTGDNVVNMLGKAVVLRSSSGASQTTIDGQSVRRGIMCGFGETAETRIEGFTITNCQAIWFDQDDDGQADAGEDDGGGITCWSSSPTIVNCIIANNHAPSSGGGIYSSNGSSPTVTGCTFTGNWTETGSGGGLYAGEGDLTITNCSFSNNTAESYGGGIYGSDSLTLTDCSFAGNTASNGGGVSIQSAEATLTGCNFNDNQATDNTFLGGGGGIRTFQSSPLLINCSFVNNSASAGSTADYNGGGAIHCWSSEEVPITAVLRNCTFTGNAGRNGGAILCYGDSSPDLKNCVLTDNTASRFGGGIYCREDSPPVLSGCTFTNNQADASGGGLYCSRSDPAMIVGCTFESNHSGVGGSGSGGGLHFTVGSAHQLQDCVFLNNTSKGYGGGLYVYGWGTALSGCEFHNNDSTWGGGGAFLNDSGPNVAECTFTGNSVDEDGGGLYVDGNINLSQTAFRDNTAGDRGGGYYNSEDVDVPISDCIWINNHAVNKGGGIYQSDGNYTISNCRITNNTSAAGGGIYSHSHADLTLVDATVCRNDPTQVEGGWTDGGGNWVEDTCPAGDCNGNGVADGDDIAGGTSMDCDEDAIPDECEPDCDLDGIIDDCDSEADIDGNGVPDNCDPDCNGNGLPDAWDISSGTSDDCQGDGDPDDCQLENNDCDGDLVPVDCQISDNDCNENGTHDACDISGGASDDQNTDGIPDECQDCNDNGVLDPDDIAQGTSADCQGNGVPDECEYGEPTLGSTLSIDDGAIDVILGFPDTPAQYAWLNQYEVESGIELIGAIELAWGQIPWGHSAKVIIWSDPDGNGDPTDAELLLEVDTTIQSPNTSNGPAAFVTVAIPPTYIGPAGTSFFAGAFYADTAGTAYPVAVDQDAPAGRSFWASSAGALDVGDLAGTASVFGSLLEVGFDGNLLVRVRSIVDDNAADCNTNGILDACEIAAGDAIDRNCDWIIDQCQCLGNFIVDGNELVDRADLLALLSFWNTSGSDGDLDCSGTVGVIDLLLALELWGPCP